MSRRGMTLIELLGTIPLLLVAIAVSAVLYPVLLQDIPNLQRVFNDHGGLEDVLRRVGRDVDAAMSLPESHGGQTAGEKLLLIALPDGVVCYRVADGLIVREELFAGADGEARRTDTWSLPRAKMSFGRWRRGGAAFAVDVHTAVRYRMRNRVEDRLANTHVFHLAALGGRRAEP